MIYLNLYMRLEHWMNRQLKDSPYYEYEAIICGEDEMYTLMKKGLIYEVICLKKGTVKLNHQDEEFWKIIRLVEEKRTVKSRYEKMIELIRQKTPDLLNERVRTTIVSGIKEYPIVLACTAIVITFFYPPLEHALTDWVQSII